jgi:DNA-binding LytR/AlgR family response regulator
MLLNLDHRKTHKDIEGYTKDGIKQINVPDIYYIESEDKTAVIFCE